MPHFCFQWAAVIFMGLCAYLPQALHAAQNTSETYAGRTAIVYVPDQLPPAGQRALVVVLHGGLGSAERIADRKSESAINFNAVADAGGFIVAYLNGTGVARMLSDERRGWNAGACCGVPADKKVDDVSYIQAAVKAIAQRYGIEEQRVFGVGHSNGAMMTQRVMCETRLYAAAVPISGGLETGATTCPDAQGKRLLAIHGAEDKNVPVEGGRGSKGLSRTAYASQAATARVWQNAGATYVLQVVPGADHGVEAIDAQIAKTESQTLAQKITRYFGLLSPS
jgi:polyhydroxybutyrate depolymerase